MPVENGATVSVHYVGTLDDGTEFDRSTPDSPLVFEVGSGQVIPGFDQALLGRNKGDSFSVRIEPSEAYGDSDPRLIIPVSRDQFPANLEIAVGVPLHISTDQGELEVTVSGMDEKNILLDANHPMAGKALNFALEVVDVT